MPEDKSASCINFIRLRRDRVPSVTSGECWGVNVACLLTEEVQYWWQSLRMCRQSVDLRSVSRSSGTGGPRFLTCAFKAPHAARPPAGSWVTEDLVKGISCFEWHAPLLPPVCHRSQRGGVGGKLNQGDKWWRKHVQYLWCSIWFILCCHGNLHGHWIRGKKMNSAKHFNENGFKTCRTRLAGFEIQISTGIWGAFWETLTYEIMLTSFTPVVPNHWAMGHLVPGCTGRINNLFYFHFTDNHTQLDACLFQSHDSKN